MSDNRCTDHFVEKCPICKPHAGSVPIQPVTAADSIVASVDAVPVSTSVSFSPPPTPHTFKSTKATKVSEAAEQFALACDAVAEVAALIQEKRDEIENLTDRLEKETKRRDTAQAELRGLVGQ